MSRFRIFLVLLVAAGAGIFALRYRSLRQLEAEQEQLRAALGSNTPPVRVDAPAPATEVSTNAALSDDERSELLRLRGEIGGLRQEYTQVTNQLARAMTSPRRRTQPSGESLEQNAARQEAIGRMNRGRQWTIALLLYASDHGDRFPDALGAAVLPSGAPGDLDEFEYLLGGVELKTIRFPATTIALREKQPKQSPDGHWSRAYGFVDGHTEIARSDTSDFSDWEAKHRPPETPAAGQ